MRRRISITMVAMVVAALAVVGLGTLGLTALDSVHQTQSELVSEARELAKGVTDEFTAGHHHHGTLAVLRSTINVLKSPLKLQGEALLAVSPQLTLVNFLDPKSQVSLPSGLKPGQLDVANLVVTQQPMTGRRGRLVWAAFLFSPSGSAGTSSIGDQQFNDVNLVVVLTRDAPTGVAGAAPWYALTAAAVILVALLAANGLGRRIARPLQRTETVTRRIAEGDLGARVEVAGSEGAELVSLANSVNQMAASLARAQGTQRQFLMSVSHDLRTPLTSIRGFAEALADGATTDVKYAAGVIGSEARRLERLVTDLLELAKLESGAFSLHSTSVDLSSVVTEAVQAFEPAAAGLGLELVLETATAGEVTCQADPDRLGQVVANLVENAFKYASSKVVVTTAEVGGQPAFTVEDDGPGIPAAELERVFERLYQSRTVAGRNLGSGLGLAIVEELVTAMGGRAKAELLPDRGEPRRTGARFVVTLPAEAASDVAGQRSARAAPPQ